MEGAERREAADSSALEGAGLAQDAHDLVTRVAGGDWTEGLISLLSAGLDVKSFLQDPLAKLTSMGLGWVIEHLGPLQDALDWVTGDQQQLGRLAETWTGIGGELLQTGKDLDGYYRTDTAHWSGAATVQYQRFCADRVNLYTAAAGAAQSVSQTVSICKGILAVIRSIVRDLITDCIGKVISIIARYPPPTTPLALPEIAGQAVTTGGRIMTWMRKLQKAFANAGQLFKESGNLFRSVRSKQRMLRNIDDAAGSIDRMARNLGASVEEAAAKSDAFRDAGIKLAKPDLVDVGQIPKHLAEEMPKAGREMAEEIPLKAAVEGAKEIVEGTEEPARLYDGPGPHRVSGTL